MFIKRFGSNWSYFFVRLEKLFKKYLFSSKTFEYNFRLRPLMIDLKYFLLDFTMGIIEGMIDIFGFICPDYPLEEILERLSLSGQTLSRRLVDMDQELVKLQNQLLTCNESWYQLDETTSNNKMSTCIGFVK